VRIQSDMSEARWRIIQRVVVIKILPSAEDDCIEPDVAAEVLNDGRIFRLLKEGILTAAQTEGGRLGIDRYSLERVE